MTNTDLQTLVTQMQGVFDEVKAGGLIIVGAAIAVGLVFIGARWLWARTRQWLAKAG